MGTPLDVFEQAGGWPLTETRSCFNAFEDNVMATN